MRRLSSCPRIRVAIPHLSRRDGGRLEDEACRLGAKYRDRQPSQPPPHESSHTGLHFLPAALPRQRAAQRACCTGTIATCITNRKGGLGSAQPATREVLELPLFSAGLLLPHRGPNPATGKFGIINMCISFEMCGGLRPLAPWCPSPRVQGVKPKFAGSFRKEGRCSFTLYVIIMMRLAQITTKLAGFSSALSRARRFSPSSSALSNLCAVCREET